MESLGFACQEDANVADFLTGVTVPTERRIRPGYELTFPRTAEEVKEAYEKSSIYGRMRRECDYPFTEEARENTARFKQAVAAEKHTQLPRDSPLTVSFTEQVKACVMRQYQIVWGDKTSFLVKQLFTIMQALVMGSLFYNAPDNSSGLFGKSGALFFSLLYNALLSMTEVSNSFSGRSILIKHRYFALHHPAAFCVAQIAADIPLVFFQISVFSVIMYFLVGLEASAGVFFTYWLILAVTTVCMTALFRAIGASFSAFDGAAKMAGLTITSAMMYTGYMVQKPQMHPWFVWIYWINPLAYAFDALLSNEFHGKIIPCVGNNLVPNGPGYSDAARQSCAGVPGAVQGQTFLTGDQYLAALTYSHTHIWRNVGIIVAFWALFVIWTVISTSRWRAPTEGGSTLLIPRECSKPLKQDEEAPAEKSPITHSRAQLTSHNQLLRTTSLLTFQSLSYILKSPHGDGDLTLLSNIQGWVKPGMLGALMGASGAGKTTLLDVLAQRKTDGVVTGSILVDGRPLPLAFARSAGYCEQLDVHEPWVTVREALEFSALTRQGRNVSRKEKLEYVERVIELLELQDLADTLIGTPGNGLSVEQRKRVTIGVELVAKPSIVLFLDEPTSGLDGQAAYNTVRFLRKLADAGQAVLVTIHQPSAQVFGLFDALLLLAPGGRTAFFGEMGPNGSRVRDYFARYGAPCPEDANLAEHIIDVVSGRPPSQGKDWAETWLSSPEHAAVTRELDTLIATAAAKPPQPLPDDSHEYALPLWEQIKLVTSRTSLSLYRNTPHLNNKLMMHLVCALFNGFTFFQIGDSLSDLQLRVFSVFNFVFVAPGVINQMQPLFLQRRALFEGREHKSRMYSTTAFVTAVIVAEIPYLILCGVVYFTAWYFTAGFPISPSRSLATLLTMLLFELVYTGIGQFEAAAAPNELFAALTNPVVLGLLISFCGVLVPYAQMASFWKHWMYWINPFTYLVGAMMVFGLWKQEVMCKPEELAVLKAPGNLTCGEYLAGYLKGMGTGARLLDPDAVGECRVCAVKSGSVYLKGLNLRGLGDGWRNVGVAGVFVVSSWVLVYVFMWLRVRRRG